MHNFFLHKNILIFRRFFNSANRFTVGNFTDEQASLSVKIGKKYLNVQAKPHSFNTYIWK